MTFWLLMPEIWDLGTFGARFGTKLTDSDTIFNDCKRILKNWCLIAPAALECKPKYNAMCVDCHKWQLRYWRVVFSYRYNQCMSVWCYLYILHLKYQSLSLSLDIFRGCEANQIIYLPCCMESPLCHMTVMGVVSMQSFWLSCLIQTWQGILDDCGGHWPSGDRCHTLKCKSQSRDSPSHFQNSLLDTTCLHFSLKYLHGKACQEEIIDNLRWIHVKANPQHFERVQICQWTGFLVVCSFAWSLLALCLWFFVFPLVYAAGCFVQLPAFVAACLCFYVLAHDCFVCLFK